MLKSNEIIRLISEISNHITHEPNIDLVLKSVIENIHTVLNANRASILLFDETRKDLVMKVSIGIDRIKAGQIRIPMGKGIAGYVAETKKCLLLTEDKDFEKFGIRHDPLKYKQKSAISVPLLYKEHLLRVLNLNDKNNNEKFDQNDFLVTKIIANQAAVAINNSNLFNHYLEKVKLKQSILVAREIQQHFLPKISPKLPGFSIVSWGKTCDETGGDYYDFFHYLKDQFAIIIGDVAGHGIGAALIMASARAALKAYAEDLPNVEDVYFKLNNLLESNLVYSNFMTLLMVLLNTKDGSFRYISGGHDGPLLYKQDEKKFISYSSNGMVLGVLSNVTYTLSESIKLEKNDFFLLFTDGLYELRNEKGEIMGKKKLIDYVSQHNYLSPEELLKKIISFWHDYKGLSNQEDDISLIIVKKD